MKELPNGPRMATHKQDEDTLIAWLRRHTGSDLLGDDAVLLPAADRRVLTVDSQIEGVHFPAGLDPALLARRLLAVNLSDLAAVGAMPRQAVLALSTGPDFDHRRFFVAFTRVSGTHGVELAGGDLAKSPGGTVATLTLIGELPSGGRFLRRGDARVADGIWVSGALGESAAGQRLVTRGARLAGRQVRLPESFRAPESLARTARRAVRRHLLPKPQLALGRRLGALPRAAAMDLSDGLARDLPRLCRESGVGAEVKARALPRAAGFSRLCEALGENPLDLAVKGGEDYVLLFTLSPEIAAPEGCHRIGKVIAGEELRLLRDDGETSWPRGGWDHLDP